MPATTKSRARPPASSARRTGLDHRLAVPHMPVVPDFQAPLDLRPLLLPSTNSELLLSGTLWPGQGEKAICRCIQTCLLSFPRRRESKFSQQQRAASQPSGRISAFVALRIPTGRSSDRAMPASATVGTPRLQLLISSRLEIRRHGPHGGLALRHAKDHE